MVENVRVHTLEDVGRALLGCCEDHPCQNHPQQVLDMKSANIQLIKGFSHSCPPALVSHEYISKSCTVKLGPLQMIATPKRSSGFAALQSQLPRSGC